MMRNSRIDLEPDAAGRRRPADHRRKRAGRAADHDVLRRPALEPHRVDDGVEEDREGEQPGRQHVDHQAEEDDREAREHQAEGQRLAGLDAARRNRAVRGARHHRIDVGVVPHVERAGGAGADRDASQRKERQHRMEMTGRDHHPDQRREHDERHHPRLHQRQVVAGAGHARLGVGDRARQRSSEFGAFAHKRHHLIRGSSLN